MKFHPLLRKLVLISCLIACLVEIDVIRRGFDAELLPTGSPITTTTIITASAPFDKSASLAVVTSSKNASQVTPLAPTHVPVTAAQPVSTSTPVVAPKPSPTSTTTTSSVAVAPIDISMKSIVGLWCYYTSTSSQINLMAGSDFIVFQSTGVIINPQGYILTAKHVVDPKWTGATYASSSDSALTIYNNINFDHCDVGVPPDGYSLPTPQEIKDSNPALVLGPMRYKAVVYFDPPREPLMSDTEFQGTDFSILKIVGAADDCSTWYTDCSASGPFPYSPVLYSSTPSTKVQLLTYGYPFEASEDYVDKLFLKGAVGRINTYDPGDGYYKNTPFTINWTADDVMGGRSGSSAFWNGYAIGTLYSRTNDTLNSQILGMPAIQKVLQDNGLGNLLRTN